MREIKIRAFRIENPDIAQTHSDLCAKLKEILKKSSSAETRRMQLNADDVQKEEDLLSYFADTAANAEYQFCTMLRIAPGNEIQHISNGLFNKEKFTLSDLNASLVDAEAIYKDHYYFAVSNNFAVTDLPGNTTIRRLQTYLNWLLSGLYELTPLVEITAMPNLSNVRNITIQDPISQQTIEESEKREKSVFDLKAMAVDYLKSLINDATSLKDEDLAQIVSAKLVVEFSRPKKSTSEELQKIYGALLKPVADTDHVLIKTRDNKTIAKGKDILRIRRVKIDETDSGKVNENTVNQEMQKFLRDLENEKKNSG